MEVATEMDEMAVHYSSLGDSNLVVANSDANYVVVVDRNFYRNYVRLD